MLFAEEGAKGRVLLALHSFTDELDELISSRSSRNPGFPEMVKTKRFVRGKPFARSRRLASTRASLRLSWLRGWDRHSRSSRVLNEATGTCACRP
jgi:hypothetical protein